MLIELEPVQLGPEAEELRHNIRQFLVEECEQGAFIPQCDGWLAGWNPEFSRKLAARGWLGMTWPKVYGGKERSGLERFVALEELLAAGAPVAAHWVAERQMGPMLLHYGTEEQRRRYLPIIARGESFWAIGMSEPNAGSDLANIRSKLTCENGRWILSGQKVWSSGAHRCHYMMALCRVAGMESPDRHAGMANVIVDLSAPRVSIRPIRLMTGEHHFDEVLFNDVQIDEDMIIGELGDGWRQVTAELAYERSGPERFLSTFPLLQEWMRASREGPSDQRVMTSLAILTSELWALRQLSLTIAGMLDKGQSPDLAASLVKDLGTRYERAVTEAVESVVSLTPRLSGDGNLARLLAQAVLHGPGFTLRGGTNEILRGIVARGLGLR